jgi:acyl carrier protein
METTLVREEVLGLLKKLGCDVTSVYPTQDLGDDLGIDSTEMVELVAVVRTQYGLSLQPSVWKGIRTVEDLSNIFATAPAAVRER